MSLKKTLIKNYLKIQLIKNEPGYMKIRIGNLRKLDNQYKSFENEVIALIQLLPGITEMNTNFTTGEIDILYDETRLDAKTLMRWINTVVDVAIDNLDFIKTQWENNLDGVIKKLTDVLQEKIKNNFS